MLVIIPRCGTIFGSNGIIGIKSQESLMIRTDNGIVISSVTTAKPIEQSEQWIVLAQQAYDYAHMIKELEAKHKQTLDQLKRVSAGKTSHGGGYLFAKELRKGSIAYNEIPFLMGVDLEPYRKPDVEYWKLSKIA